MIIVRVELLSATTGKLEEIGRMTISNRGDAASGDLGNYDVDLMRRGTEDKVLRRGVVMDHKRLTYSVWTLVSKALKAVRF